MVYDVPRHAAPPPQANLATARAARLAGRSPGPGVLERLPGRLLTPPFTCRAGVPCRHEA